VLYADLDGFYASVEQRDAPALHGRPVIVGGGVVLAASYEAKARGVRTAMGGRQARELCPDAVVVPPRMDAYSAASRTQIVDRLARRLRDGDRTCRTIVLRLRFGDFAKATRSRTLGFPSDRMSVLLTVARGLLAAGQPEVTERGITLIGVSLSQLGRSDSFQPEMPIDWDDGARLDTVLDAVRDRFGATSIARAAQLGRDPGWSTPPPAGTRMTGETDLRDIGGAVSRCGAPVTCRRGRMGRAARPPSCKSERGG